MEMTAEIKVQESDLIWALRALLLLNEAPDDDEDRIGYHGQAAWFRPRVRDEVRTAIEDKTAGLKILRELETMGFIKNGITTVNGHSVRVVYMNVHKIASQLALRGYDVD